MLIYNTCKQYNFVSRSKCIALKVNLTSVEKKQYCLLVPVITNILHYINYLKLLKSIIYFNKTMTVKFTKMP